jgi:hypothetical protein
LSHWRFHPFADPLVVPGLGAVGLEVLDDLTDIDAILILIAIGSGGLIAGMSTAIQALKPSVTIIGVEPVGSPTRSIDTGRVVTLDAVTSRVPAMPWPADRRARVRDGPAQCRRHRARDRRRDGRILALALVRDGVAADLSGAEGTG